MADETTVDSTTETAAEGAAPAKKTTARKTAAKKTAAKKAATPRKTASRRRSADAAGDAELPLEVADQAPAPTDAPIDTPADAPARRTSKRAATEAAQPAAKRATRKRAAAHETPESAENPATPEIPESIEAPAKKTAAKKAAAKKTAAKKTAATKTTTRKAAAKKTAAPLEAPVETDATAAEAAVTDEAATDAASATSVLFQAPAKKTATRRRTRKTAEPAPEEAAEAEAVEATDVAAAAETVEAAEAAEAAEATQSDQADQADQAEDGEAPARRRRRRGGRRRRKSGGNDEADSADSTESEDGEESDEGDQGESGDAAAESGSSRRRRRRRRAGDAGDDEGDNPPNTVTKVRESRPLEQQITAVSGSTRLEAKKQRRREGREAGRRRAPIVSEAEFLARRESVERVMVIRQRDDLTQIGVLEDKVLVEHYVARESQTSLIGNIYLGRVQNVLPSMEAAFIDIGKGRNAVLYAGEVNWSSLGWKEGQPRKIESVLSSGQSVLVQVTKDPIGHKGARLTSQISLAGRFLVYVPDGTTSGISRKLPDTERNRLKTLLKEIVPDTAGVIVRTAAEGASEEELTRDVERLKARWDAIEAKAKGSAPQLLYGEPDLTLKVVRDLFTEDFGKLVIQGEDAWETVQGYVSFVAPDLEARLERFVPGEDGKDAFATYRIDEQIAKGLDRKVWLPSGGSLIIDRTEAMTVIDVNTGKFTGSGGNLEETVTKNNLEAAEEIVRQLRLRDIGGIIVVDFIDMVLESNRDLVLRRLVECLGRDRTRHQVAEVTSLGLVQMTRKRIGTGLLEAFSETCTHCQGRGIVVHDHPVEEGKSSGVLPDEPRRGRRSRGGRGRGGAAEERPEERHEEAPKPPSPAVVAAMARHHDDDAAAGDAAAGDTAVDTTGDTTGDTAPAEGRVADEAARTPLEPVEVPSVDVEPVTEPVTEPAQPEARAKPKVVTRTRRGASRAVVTTGEAAVVEAPAPVETPTPAVVLEESAPPAPPKVVTRRRRGASRDVTTAVSGPDGSMPEAPAVEVAPEVPSEDGAGPVVEHVPVKKRGARKR